MKNLHLPFWIAGSAALCLLAIAKPAWSQVTADGSTTTDVDLTMTSCLSTFCISNNGISSPPNEFHSFSQFSVGAGEIAEFIPAMGIENIIVRVIGSSVSDIQGTIFVDTLFSNPVNLFFINPNGIILGSDSSLIGINSFIASTASAIKFADGTEFSATDTTPPVLTSSIPSSLEFRGVAGPIVINGGATQFQFLNPIDSSLPSQTLALVGGDVTFTSANVKLDSGRVEIGSVAGSGSVGLTQVTKGWALDYSGIQTPNTAGKLFGNIQLSQGSAIDVGDDSSQAGGGEVQVRGDRVTLENSIIDSYTQHGTSGGDITVTASSVEIKGELLYHGQTFPAGFLAESEGSGAAGNIAINTQQLTLTDGGTLSTATSGSGAAGNIAINTQQLTLTNGSTLSTDTSGNGQGGNMAINTQQLTLTDGSILSTATSGDGQAGNMAINTQQLTLTDGSTLSTATYGNGQAGNMAINTQQLTLTNGSTLLTATYGNGQGGNMAINTQQLILKDGGTLSSATFANGQAGNINVNATKSVELSGTSSTNQSSSGLSSATFNAGNAGNLTINTSQLIISNQAFLNASSQREPGITTSSTLGNAGKITINATDSVQITGISPTDRLTGIFSQATGNTGTGGNITIATGKLIQRDGAAISTANASTTGGNIAINAKQIQMFNGSVISADSFGSATGGTITITTDFIFGQGNSDIVSGATNNRGGQIVVNAIGIFGLQKRDNLTPGNDIVTDSALGVQFNGTVTLNTPDIDPLRGLIEQPKIPAPGKVASGCDASGAIASNPNYLIQPGKGGLSPTPTDPISSLGIWDDMRSMNISNGDRSPAVDPQATSSRRSQKEIRVAQGWIWKDETKETVALVTNPAGVVANTNVQAAAACHNSRS